MNSIRQIQELNKRELEQGIPPSASWHTDYRDTAYIYIGGLPFELSEGDVLTIFSQYGEPTYINLVRDKETGKSRGFAFLKYEDQRSTDLAVDNLGGTVISGRTLRVDHTRYKRKDGEEDTGLDLSGEMGTGPKERDGEERRKRRRLSGSESERDNDSEEERPLLKEERELALLIRDHDEDDPMKAFLIEEKKEEIAKALARVKEGAKSEKESRRHRHHHRSRRNNDDGRNRGSHRSRRDGDEDRDGRSSRRIKDESDGKDDGYRSRHRGHGHHREMVRDREVRKRSRSPADNSRRDRRLRERSPSEDRRRRYS